MDKKKIILRNDVAKKRKERVKHLNFSIPIKSSIDYHEIQLIESRKRGVPISKKELCTLIFLHGMKTWLNK